MCTACAVLIEGDLLEEEATLARLFQVQPVVRAVGCELCGISGYRGRRPVVELIAPSPDLLRLIAESSSHVDMVMQARADGMRTMLEAALDLVREGKTTLSEVERVVGEEDMSTTFRAPPQDATAVSWPAEPPAAGSRSMAPRPAPVTSTPIADDDEEELRQALVVDDDADTRFLVRAVLESHGWIVTECEDGREALDHLRDEKVGLVVLDLIMPHVSGHEVLKAAKGSLATAGVPILMLTSQNDRQMEARVLREGADDYIRKPVDPAVFMNRVQTALRRTRG